MKINVKLMSHNVQTLQINVDLDVWEHFTVVAFLQKLARAITMATMSSLDSPVCWCLVINLLILSRSHDSDLHLPSFSSIKFKISKFKVISHFLYTHNVFVPFFL
jgi:hypothetical protein